MRYEQTRYDMSMPVLNSSYDNAITHTGTELMITSLPEASVAFEGR